MNAELEKLVNYALVDGYITDKEKQVLVKKAQAAGFDLDELEMILEGRLYEINKATKPKVNKCPSCGEIISGLSKVCPSCDYVLNSEPLNDSETLQDDIKRLEDSIYSIKFVPKPGSSAIFNSVILIIITGGLYILYKKFIKKEILFDRYAPLNERIVAVTELQIRNLENKYGEDQKISNYINQLVTERDAIIKKRQASDVVSAFAIFVIIGIITYFIVYVANLPGSPKKETAEEKIERSIKAGKVSDSKKYLEELPDNLQKGVYVTQVIDLEIDSLVKAGKVQEAIEFGTGYNESPVYINDIYDKMNPIIVNEVHRLVEKKEYETARKVATSANFATYMDLNALVTKAKEADEAVKEAEKAKTKKVSRKKRKK
jgi:hypothetical protein